MAPHSLMTLTAFTQEPCQYEVWCCLADSYLPLVPINKNRMLESVMRVVGYIGTLIKLLFCRVQCQR